MAAARTHDDDVRVGTECEYFPAVPAAGHAPLGLLLPAQRPQPGGSAYYALYGSYVHRRPDPWHAALPAGFKIGWNSHQPSQSPPANEGYAYQDDLLQATHHSDRSQSLQVPVFIAGACYYPGKPGLADRHQLYSDGWWVYVSGSDYRCVQPVYSRLGYLQ